MKEFLNYGGLFLAFCFGAAVAATAAVLIVRQWVTLLKFHAVREWREPVDLGGELYVVLPEAEYKHLDRMRHRILAAVPATPRGAPAALGMEKASFQGTNTGRVSDIPGRPDHDMDTRGGPLVPGR